MPSIAFWIPLVALFLAVFAGPAQGDFRAPHPTNPNVADFDRASLGIVLGLGTAAVFAKTFGNHEWMAGKLDGSPLDVAIDVADRYGEGSTLGLVAVGLLAIGQSSSNEEVTRIGGDLATSLVASWSATWTLKLAVGAKRPNGGAHSFPSGHTATAFAAAPVLHRHYGSAVGYAAYALATLTGLARMEDDKHYLADVLFGAAIGIVMGRTFSMDRPFRLSLPTAGTGLGLTLRF